MGEKGFSYTSNIVKLLKHMGNLQNLQKNKIARPIMVHIAQTNKCSLNCAHCCFSDRDKKLEMNFDVFKNGMKQFISIGVKAAEFTGGGEPTLYPYINESIEYLKDFGMHLGLITNGTKLDNVNVWDKLDWVRISLNGIDYGYKDKIDPDIIQGPTKTACYIWNKHSLGNIWDVIKFANFYKLPTRIAPDCIQPLADIDRQTEMLKEIVSDYKSDYIFVSDFNIETRRRNNNCYMHAIKPYFFVDGNVYVCPSAELALENGKNVNNKFLLCNFKDIESFYNKPFEKREHNCSYCKYSLQNSLLEDVLEETTHNDFA